MWNWYGLPWKKEADVKSKKVSSITILLLPSRLRKSLYHFVKVVLSGETKSAHASGLRTVYSFQRKLTCILLAIFVHHIVTQKKKTSWNVGKCFWPYWRIAAANAKCFTLGEKGNQLSSILMIFGKTGCRFEQFCLRWWYRVFWWRPLSVLFANNASPITCLNQCWHSSSLYDSL